MTMLKTVTLEPAFVIHTQSFRESSVIAVLFTRHYGKISVIAKGAQRPKSKFKFIKTPATLFSISSRGKTDLQTLIHCEITEYFDPSPNSYNFLVYLNELLTKMLEREDAHIEVFDQYLSICRSLNNSDKREIEANIRLFEVILLREAGYGLDFKSEAHSKESIKEDSTYKFDPMSGFLRLKEQIDSGHGNRFEGKDIINFSRGDLSSSSTRKASKEIMRRALDFHLGPKKIKIREYLSLKGQQR